MKDKIKKYNNIIKGICAFIIYFSSSIIQQLLVLILNMKDINMKEAVILNCIASGIIVLLLILLYKNDLKNEWKIFKKDLSNNIDTGFKWWLIGLIGMVIFNIIISFILNAGQAENEQIVQKMIDTLPYLFIISAGVFAPINEEIIFRKVFKDNIKNELIFVLVAGFIFGYLHVSGASSIEQFLYIIPYSSLGISFAIMYNKTNTVFTSISMHMFHNTLLTILSIIG